MEMELRFGFSFFLICSRDANANMEDFDDVNYLF